MKWTVTHRGVMIITVTVIGESCLPPRAANETWEYEYTFNFHSNKKNQREKKKKTHKRKQVSCENRGLKQQTAIFSGLILISQLSECLLLIYMLVCAGGKWCQGIYTFELSMDSKKIKDFSGVNSFHIRLYATCSFLEFWFSINLHYGFQWCGLCSQSK